MYVVPNTFLWDNKKALCPRGEMLYQEILCLGRRGGWYLENIK